MFLCGLGEGLEPALQALASSIVGEHLYADLFSLVSTLDTLAKLFAGPVMAWAFSIRKADGQSGGYCFLLSSVRVLNFCLRFFTSESTTIQFLIC